MKADDPRHGTANGYANLDCRCERCRAAHAAWCRDYMHRKGLSRPWEEYLAERARCGASGAPGQSPGTTITAAAATSAGTRRAKRERGAGGELRHE